MCTSATYNFCSSVLCPNRAEKHRDTTPTVADTKGPRHPIPKHPHPQTIYNTSTMTKEETEEETAKAAGSDAEEAPEAKEGKRKERLEQNRISARESRKRKKQMIEELQRYVTYLIAGRLRRHSGCDFNWVDFMRLRCHSNVPLLRRQGMRHGGGSTSN